jgi:hypothetical protein
MNTQMQAHSRAVVDRKPGMAPFSEEEVVQCMSQITPIVIGVSKVASLLKATDAITNYSGGRIRRRQQPLNPQDGMMKSRLHRLRPIEHKGGTIASRVGLGKGWEKFGSGTPVDSPRRKFKV